MDISEKWIFNLIGAYGYTYKEFMDYMENRPRLPEDTLQDCTLMLNKLTSDKLRPVYGVLQSFMERGFYLGA